jgi:tRNA (cytidine32/uridine32-2'-O)-methyltransferase
MAPETRPVTFALVHPSEPGNAGAAARSLAAFGFGDLCLIAPRQLPDETDQALAVRWGRAVLDAAVVVSSSRQRAYLARFDEIWGTTGRSGRQRRIETAPDLIAEHLRRRPGPLLILFGPERDGLNKEWLDRCHRLVRLPTPGGPLNLAHAVTVIAYEFRRQLADAPARETGASAEQRRELLRRTEVLLHRIGYPSRSLRRHPPEAYLEPLRSGPLTRRQVRWMLGLLARLERRIPPSSSRQDR